MEGYTYAGEMRTENRREEFKGINKCICSTNQEQSALDVPLSEVCFNSGYQVMKHETTGTTDSAHDPLASPQHAHQERRRRTSNEHGEGNHLFGWLTTVAERRRRESRKKYEETGSGDNAIDNERQIHYSFASTHT